MFTNRRRVVSARAGCAATGMLCLSLIAPAVSLAATGTVTKNLRSSCATHGDKRDLFPEKATVSEAAGLRIRYAKSYKVVDVLTPWRDARKGFRYVLVQCGTAAPPLTGELAGAQVIQIPLKTTSIMSTVMAPALDALGEAGRIVSVDNTDYYSTATVVERIKSGKIVATGGTDEVNLERLVSLKPTAVISYGVSDASLTELDRLRNAGLPVIVEAGYMERTSLGRAEWIKFYGALTNQDAQAEALYKKWAADYRSLAARAAAAPSRPAVISGSMFEGTWYMPGGQSFAAQLIRDAGGSYAWSSDTTNGSIPLDFEAVFAKSADAPIWINAGFLWKSLGDAYKEDTRYARLASAKSANVWGNDLKVNATGGNDYFESATIRPDLLLADLVSILHPELLPEHQQVWYRRIPAK